MLHPLHPFAIYTLFFFFWSFFKVLKGRKQNFVPQEVKKKKVNLLFSKTEVSLWNECTSLEKNIVYNSSCLPVSQYQPLKALGSI